MNQKRSRTHTHTHTQYIQSMTSKHQRHLYVEIIYFTIHRAIFLADNRTFVVGFLLFYTKFTSIIYSAVAEKLFTHKKSWQIFLLVPGFCISHEIFGHGSFKQKQQCVFSAFSFFGAFASAVHTRVYVNICMNVCVCVCMWFGIGRQQQQQQHKKAVEGRNE